MVQKYFILIFFLFSLIACRSDSNSKQIDNETAENVDLLGEDESRIELLASTKINLEAFDKVLLARLILNEINEKRLSQNVSHLEADPNLTKAAKNQNDYQLRINQLTHNQDDPKMTNLMDRVLRFGGQFNKVAENVQFIELTVVSFGDRQDVVTPTYAKAAELLTQGWTNSEGHNQNLMNSAYQYAGTAVDFNSDRGAIFATQVYGGGR